MSRWDRRRRGPRVVVPTRERLAEDDSDLLFADGFDDAILGVIERPGQEAFVLYDAEHCIDILLRDNRDMTRVQAEEHFSFNVAGAWVGERTPGFVRLPEPSVDEEDSE